MAGIRPKPAFYPLFKSLKSGQLLTIFDQNDHRYEKPLEASAADAAGISGYGGDGVGVKPTAPKPILDSLKGRSALAIRLLGAAW